MAIISVDPSFSEIPVLADAMGAVTSGNILTIAVAGVLSSTPSFTVNVTFLVVRSGVVDRF